MLKIYEDSAVAADSPDRSWLCFITFSVSSFFLHDLLREYQHFDVFYVFAVHSDEQTCVTEQDRDKSHRPLILDVGETSVKIIRAGKPRAPQETSSHSEMSS